MPGRNRAEAYRTFVEPIQAAVACLGPAKIIGTPNARSAEPGEICQWTLNGDEGMLRRQLRLRARMRFGYVDRGGDSKVPAAERWKVTTLGYMYQIEVAGERAFDYHWHPESALVQFPHMHAQRAILRQDGVITSRAHLPSGRVALESVVRMLITEMGWPPAVSDWDQRLTLSESVFRLYSSWSRDPHHTSPEGQ